MDNRLPENPSKHCEGALSLQAAFYKKKSERFIGYGLGYALAIIRGLIFWYSASES